MSNHGSNIYVILILLFSLSVVFTFEENGNDAHGE